jgi:hypothetical protein
MNRRTLFAGALVIVTVAATCSIALILWRRNAVRPKQHVLESPMWVFSGLAGSHGGVLPTGTSLRYLKAFPEGFDRYEVIVNVERHPLPLSDVDPPEMVDPLAATGNGGMGKPSDEEVAGLLRELGMTRADLQRIIDGYDRPPGR